MNNYFSHELAHFLNRADWLLLNCQNYYKNITKNMLQKGLLLLEMWYNKCKVK